MEIFSLLILGMIAGTLAGLLGVGGGIVIVPALVFIFQSYAKIPINSLMHVAIGTSLATIVLTSLSSIIAHHRRGAVRWLIVWQLTPGIIIGALLGAIIADALPSELLRKIFAIFILLVSIQIGFLVPPSASNHQLPSRWGGLTIAMGGFFGTMIGSISAIVGIGGGSLTVPFLVYCNVSIRNAIATSAACGFPIAVSGAIGFIITGWHVSDLPAQTIGYIYLPAFIAITSTTLLFAPLGAKLAHTIPVNTLNFLRYFWLL